jgi:hypothetical protein
MVGSQSSIDDGELNITATLTFSGIDVSTTQTTLHLLTSKTFVTIDKISGPSILENQGDEIILQYKVDNPTGNTV